MPVLLDVAGLARSTFYYQCKALAVADRHADVKAAIKAIFDRHQGRYGYRRITVVLRQLGHALNHKVVQRLMQAMELKSQLERELTRYIHYYNHERIMLKLKGLSPVQYRTQPLAA